MAFNAFTDNLNLNVAENVKFDSDLYKRASGLEQNVDVAFKQKTALTVPQTDAGRSPNQAVSATRAKGRSTPPKPRSVSDIKAALLRPALTSNYECQFVIPQEVQNVFPANKISPAAGGVDEYLTLSCSEANLPGSTFATHEVNNDFIGITERYAYRRLYDDRADFTFYVDRNYTPIKVFEVWMRYIGGEQISNGRMEDRNFYSKVRYPLGKDGNGGYVSKIFVKKFEKDYKRTPMGNAGLDAASKNYITYVFVDAYPIAINSMPISYDNSQLLKVTVSFSYSRYYLDNISNSDFSPPGNSDVNITPQPLFGSANQNIDFGINNGKEFSSVADSLSSNPLGPLGGGSQFKYNSISNGKVNSGSGADTSI